MRIIWPYAIWMAVGIITLALVILLQPTEVNFYDEAVVLVAALQVQVGIHPGTGFFSVYGPFQYLVSAGLLSFFDGNIIALRLYHSVTVAATILALAAVLARGGSAAERAAAILFAGFAVYAYSEIAFALYTAHMLAAFGAVFVFAITRFPHAPAQIKIAALAVFIFCLVLLVPMRAGQIVGMLLVAVPFHQLHSGDPSRSGIFAALGRFGLACLLAGIGVGLYEWATDGSLWATVSFLLSDHIAAYAAYRRLPIPGLADDPGLFILFWLPVLSLFLGGAIYLYGLLRPQRLSASFRSRLFWLLFFCAACFPSAFIRTSEAQLLPANVFALASLCLILAKLAKRMDRTALPWGAAALVVVLWSVYALDRLPHADAFANDCPVGAITESPMSCLRIGDRVAWQARQQQIATLDQFLAPDEQIFVTTTRHDLIYIADLTYYFTLDRLPWTYWGHHEPGIHNTRAVQQGILDDMAAQIATNGRAVVLIQPAIESTEDNLSSVSSGVTLLDDYLEGCTLSMVLGDLQVRSCS